MIFERLFRPRPGVLSGQALYQAAVARAREPDLYLRLGAPDTVEGRFEVYTLHVIILLLRLKTDRAAAGEASQALFDAYVRGLDDGLREIGVGDLSVGKKMRKLGEAFYGRAKAYDEALARSPDLESLRALIARTVLMGDPADAGPLSDYADRCAKTLAGQSLPDLLGGHVQWAPIVP